MEALWIHSHSLAQWTYLAWCSGSTAIPMVTTALLPALRRMKHTDDPIALFERIEGAFDLQAKATTLAMGLTGLYMLHAMDAWQRYTQVHYWWLHLMTLAWLLFPLVLFVFEPLLLLVPRIRLAP